MVYCGKPSKGCQNCRERKIAVSAEFRNCPLSKEHSIPCPTVFVMYLDRPFSERYELAAFCFSMEPHEIIRMCLVSGYLSPCLAVFNLPLSSILF